MILIVTIVICVIAASIVIAYYNRFVRLNNYVREAHSGIEVQFKKRADLLPSLVKTVKAYAAHEEGLLSKISELRGASYGGSSVEKLEGVQKEYNAVMGRLLAVAENYPELKADRNFRALQDQLVEIEKGLEMARRYFNGAVRNMNNAVESFPGNVLSGMLGFESYPFFETATLADRAVPDLKF